MRRDGDGRRCDRCATTVIDLSALSEREAGRLLERARRGGCDSVCVRYRVDGDGEIRFRPAPPARGARLLAIGLGLASLVGARTPAFADSSIPPTSGSGGAGHPSRVRPSQPRPDARPPNPPVRPPKPPIEEELMGKIALTK